jgi:hypothetical protein
MHLLFAFLPKATNVHAVAGLLARSIFDNLPPAQKIGARVVMVWSINPHKSKNATLCAGNLQHRGMLRTSQLRK